MYDKMSFQKKKSMVKLKKESINVFKLTSEKVFFHAGLSIVY